MVSENEETLSEKMGKDNYALAEKLGLQKGDLVELIDRCGTGRVLYFGGLSINDGGEAMISEEERGLLGGGSVSLHEYTKIRRYTKSGEVGLKGFSDYLPKDFLAELGKE